MVVAVLAGSGSMPVEATQGSAREQREAVRAQQAAVAAQVNALQGDESSVAAALRALEANVSGQQAALSDAQRQAEVSTREAAQAEKEIAKTEQRIEKLRQQVVAYAVEAYINPPDEDVLRRMEASSATEDATKRALLEMRSGTDADSMDRLQAAREHLDDQRQRAARAQQDAQDAAVRAEQAVATLAAAKSQQETFAQQVRARLDDKLADAAYLSQVDSELGSRIAAEQAALAAAVKSVPATGAAGPRAGGTSKVASVPRPPLVTVGGITVAASIAPQLKQLLAAAAAAGFDLRGYGWRDSRNQVALRGQNCGGWSDYQLYEMPPDQCSPPTARPGASLHEQGIAVDFSVKTKFIESRDDPAYTWLAAHAPTYGFHNLPSEPWHWSTTGG
jgi:hypothetical protein